MRLKLRAPAKINWMLEVLGRRPDGFHEVKTVIQTIDLADSLELESATELTLEATGEGLPPVEEDLTMRAARLLQQRTGHQGGARMHLTKVIPIAAGLGGGSSDAAAALRGLHQLWSLDLLPERLGELAAELGSDVPFFLHGGTALSEGRGERLTPLPDAPQAALLIVVPPISIPRKTERMYSLLGPEDYGDGAPTDRFVDALRQGIPPRRCDLYNTFGCRVFSAFPELQTCRGALIKAGAGCVHLAGSGPALFVVTRDEEQQQRLAQAARDAGAQALAARTLAADAALAVEKLAD
jgi:4-diphosphocytidyl-2-C-methyl-D-erythritol kinase